MTWWDDIRNESKDDKFSLRKQLSMICIWYALNSFEMIEDIIIDGITAGGGLGYIDFDDNDQKMDEDYRFLFCNSLLESLIGV